MKKNEFEQCIYENMETLDLKNTDIKEKLINLLEVLFSVKKDKYYILLSKDYNYITFFNICEECDYTEFANQIYKFLEEEITEDSGSGGIKDFSLEQDRSSLNIWTKNSFFKLAPYGLGTVEIDNTGDVEEVCTSCKLD